MTGSKRAAPVLLADGGRYPLRLTLGALAEIETALALDGLKALPARLTEPGAGDLIVILTALMRAGGASEPDPAAMTLDPGETARLIADAFEASAR
ncbi:GTA-gp10 family protein [Marinicauda pacifica]|jgi:hypothetical protein|uniref:GTA-gp10 family protein n=1 Tax=Marinicauda pacifica TaxID=1133559 RepID=UPI0035C7D14A